MKLVACLVLFLFLANSFSQNVSPQFSELKGMEDQSTNSHLFYRIYSVTETPNLLPEIRNDIYHYDLQLGIDTLFLESYNRIDTILQIPDDFEVVNYTFWQHNPATFIYGGATETTILNEHTFIRRFDSENNYNKNGVVYNIQISSQNDSLLYAGVSVNNSAGITVTIKSADGGWNWERITGLYRIVSLNQFEDQSFIARNIMDYKLNKTTDGGSTFYLVDSSMTYWEQQYHYDNNGTHIYRVARNYYTNNYELKISSNSGEAFSWEAKYTSQDKIFISNNEFVTGEVYLANKKNINLSTDYGDNFNLYKSLNRKIVGIYKKPNSDRLYAATKYKIYEITPDSINIIKSLTIPDEVLNYYPLAVGNKWVYNKTTVEYDPYPQYSHQILVKEVLGDTIAANGKHYYLIRDETLWGGYALERNDSVEGKVYRYLEDPGLPENEYLLDDLLAEVGDTVNSYRMGYYPGSHTTVLDEITFVKWGLTKPKKVFEQYILHPPIYSLTQDIGLDSIFSYFDFGETRVILKGCIVDGIVYGDTTVVSVENETEIFPTEFSLSQNYPNPFNPITTIRFTIPIVTLSEVEGSFVTLKIYDVLGNEIVTLINEEKPAGSHEVEFNAANLPSGVYFYQLRAGGFVDTKKLILIK